MESGQGEGLRRRAPTAEKCLAEQKSLKAQFEPESEVIGRSILECATVARIGTNQAARSISLLQMASRYDVRRGLREDTGAHHPSRLRSRRDPTDGLCPLRFSGSSSCYREPAGCGYMLCPDCPVTALRRAPASSSTVPCLRPGRAARHRGGHPIRRRHERFLRHHALPAAGTAAAALNDREQYVSTTGTSDPAGLHWPTSVLSWSSIVTFPSFPSWGAIELPATAS